MSNEKQQIEEMAKYCCNACALGNQIDLENNIIPCAIDNEYKTCPLALETATLIYTAGYRKLSENVIELPCKVGDKVWCISNYTKPKEFQITILTMSENHYSFVIEADKGVYKHYCDKDSVGKYVFFTKEEAERALAKMKGGE